MRIISLTLHNYGLGEAGLRNCTEATSSVAAFLKILANHFSVWILAGIVQHAFRQISFFVVRLKKWDSLLVQNHSKHTASKYDRKQWYTPVQPLTMLNSCLQVKGTAVNQTCSFVVLRKHSIPSHWAAPCSRVNCLATSIICQRSNVPCGMTGNHFQVQLGMMGQVT